MCPSSGIPIKNPHKEAVAGGTAFCFEEPLPQEFYMTPSGSIGSGLRQSQNGEEPT